MVSILIHTTTQYNNYLFVITTNLRDDIISMQKIMCKTLSYFVYEI